MGTTLVTTILFQLQQLDLELDRLLAEKQTIVMALQGSATLRYARAEYEAAQRQLQTSLRAQKEAEVALDDLVRRLKMSQDRLYGGAVSNAKELQALRSEGQRLSEQQDHQEEVVLECIDASEILVKQAEQKRALVGREEDAWQQEQTSLQQRLDQLEARIQHMQEKRATLTRNIDEGLLKRYEGLRRTKQGKAISRIEQNSCQWCRVILTPSEIQRVRLNVELQTCMNCGRILHYDRS
ncbi:MAG: C4-type zinc ribbon domain-containing protein [Ktedonobacteraceae bacterium]